MLNTSKGTVSGYFTEHDKLAQAAEEWSGKAPGVYITLNPVNPDLFARSANRLKEYAKYTTANSDILRRRWFPIDCDPKRPSGISSNDDEHRAAIDRAKEIRNYLQTQGWPEPILADSGNGAHLLYQIDLPNDSESTELIKKCLEALAFKFSDEKVEVDLTTYNPARIWKLYGTMACKGDSTEGRPHRLAQVLEVPE